MSRCPTCDREPSASAGCPDCKRSSPYRPLVNETPEQVEIRELRDENESLRMRLDHVRTIASMMRDSHDRDVAQLQTTRYIGIMVAAIGFGMFAAHLLWSVL